MPDTGGILLTSKMRLPNNRLAQLWTRRSLLNTIGVATSGRKQRD
jgi:hypothetical protein